MPDTNGHARLDDLLHECAVAAVADEPALLARAWALFGQPAGAAEFAALLAAGAGESAAMRLVPDSAAWMLSRGGRGACLASVIDAAHGNEVSAEAATPALALVAALAASALQRNASPSASAASSVPARLN